MKRFDVRSGLRILLEQRELLRSLVIRDLQAKYRGTVFGFMWAVALPLMMLAVYAFVFGIIFKARWGIQQGEMSDFVPMLYCGLIVHGLVSETLIRAPGAILANPGYVKKVVFPLELIPVTHLISATINAGIGMVLLSLLLIAQHLVMPLTALLSPLVLLPLLFFSIGTAWFLAAVGVFFRDISQIIVIAMTMLLFLSPVFYPVSAVPPLMQKLMYLNPLTYPMETLRGLLINGTMLNWWGWLIYSLVSAAIALLGLWSFQRTRPAFADVV